MLFVVVVARVGWAQERIDVTGLAVAGLEQPLTDVAEPEPRARVLDGKFWVLAAALNTAMVLDTKSTFDVVRNCLACHEGNPLVAPFIRRGPAVTFTAGELFDAGVMTVAGKMRRSERAWARRTWWVVPAALIGGHLVAYRHNVGLLE